MLLPIGELDTRTFLVTGANTGIGRETALELARRGARVFVAGRSEPKTLPVINQIVAQTGDSALEFLCLISAISLPCAHDQTSSCEQESRCVG